MSIHYKNDEVQSGMKYSLLVFICEKQNTAAEKMLEINYQGNINRNQIYKILNPGIAKNKHFSFHDG